jgi:Lrp/AsnC family transcriptional regulator, regulator for asnA, asnC and gidA
MTNEVHLDKTDLMILGILIKDARSNLKEISKKCGLTASAVLKRTKRLRQEGIIVGTSISVDAKVFGFPFYATLLIDAADSLEPHIKKTVRAMESVIVCAESIGRFNLCALIRARNIEDIKNITAMIKNLKGIKRVAVNIWTGEPYYNYSKTLNQVDIAKVDDNGRS